MKTALCCLILALLLSIQSQAQNNFNLGLHFNFFRASSEFKENITRQPIGSSLIFLVNKGSKLQLGAELGVGLYSGKKYYYETTELGYPGNYEYLYEEDGFFQVLGVARYRFTANRLVNVYSEFKIGTSTFFSAIRTLDYSPIYEDKFRWHDTAFTIGGGVGANLDIGKIWKQEWRKRLLLDTSVSYMAGTEARYRNSIKNEITTTFEQGYRSSTTSSVLIKTGVILAF